MGHPRPPRTIPELLLTVVALALLALIAFLALGADRADARKSCGTYKSVSIYPKAKIVAIRGVKCGTARAVGVKFDSSGLRTAPWKCGYAQGGKTLFSCGYGRSSGNLRDFPHAFVAVGVGKPR